MAFSCYLLYLLALNIFIAIHDVSCNKAYTYKYTLTYSNICKKNRVHTYRVPTVTMFGLVLVLTLVDATLGVHNERNQNIIFMSYICFRMKNAPFNYCFNKGPVFDLEIDKFTLQPPCSVNGFSLSLRSATKKN